MRKTYKRSMLTIKVTMTIDEDLGQAQELYARASSGEFGDPRPKLEDATFLILRATVSRMGLSPESNRHINVAYRLYEEAHEFDEMPSAEFQRGNRCLKACHYLAQAIQEHTE